MSGQYGLTGVFEFWEDAELLLYGSHGTAFTNSLPESERRPGLALALRWAFAAARGGALRLSAVSLLPGDAMSASACCWVGAETALIAGNPPVPRALGPDSQYGNLGLKLMLVPSPLAEVVPGPWPRDFEVDGLRVAADPLAVPDFQCRGAERFRASYEPELDVITSWVAEVHGRPARKLRVTSLARA